MLPGDHLLLLVGGVAPVAVGTVRGGQEVAEVLLQVVLHQGQNDL